MDKLTQLEARLLLTFFEEAVRDGGYQVGTYSRTIGGRATGVIQCAPEGWKVLNEVED